MYCTVLYLYQNDSILVITGLASTIKLNLFLNTFCLKVRNERQALCTTLCTYTTYNTGY
jgi:hypothetical protein